MAKKKSKKKPLRRQHYWTDGLSVIESKVSVLIICLLLMVIFSVYAYIKNGDISPTLASIISSLSLAVAGVNIADRIGGYFGTNDYNQQENNNDLSG